MSDGLDAQLFDGVTPVARGATVWIVGERVRIEHDGESCEYDVREVNVSPRVAKAPRFVSLPDGRELLCADCAVLDALPSRESSAVIVAWLERRSWVAGVALALTIAVLAFAHFRGLPWLASKIAVRVSPELEARFGEAASNALDEHAFAPSEVDLEKQEAVQRAFAELAAESPSRATLRLRLRRSSAGANAFALPGGTIIVTDELVRSCTLDEVTAVLAHEVGHVERRHALRQMLVSAGVGAMAAAVFGDASSLTVAAAGVPTTLVNLRYSRAFEVEADAAAFALLERRGMSPALFADGLECIERTHPMRPAGIPSFLSSHPADEDRKQKARHVPLEAR